MAQNIGNPRCRKTGELPLAGFIERSAVNGPGIRAVVWVQGCPIRCQDCFNPGFLPFSSPNRVSVRDLADRILAIEHIEGVTFSGGEPFAHSGPLADLAELLRPGGLSVATFTGFTYSYLLKKNRRSWTRLLRATDILIAGPYRPSSGGSPCVFGSKNKQILFLEDGNPIQSTGNYDPGTMVEFFINPDGMMRVTGVPGSNVMRELSGLQGEVNGVAFQQH